MRFWIARIVLLRRRSQETARVSDHKSCVDERIFIIRYLAIFGPTSRADGDTRDRFLSRPREEEGERGTRTIRRRRLLSRFAV